jgi:predicted kinase
MPTIQSFHDAVINIQPIDLLEYQEVIPELQLMSSCDQSAPHHLEGNVLTHANLTMKEIFPLLDQIEKQEDKVALYIAAMCHDFGKKAAYAIHPKKGTITAYGHETAGLPVINEFLKKYFPEFLYKKREQILRLVENHMKPRMWAKDGTTVNKLKLLSLATNTKMLYLLSQADTLGRKADDMSSGMSLLEQFKQNCEDIGIWNRSYRVPLAISLNNQAYSLARWNILMNDAPETNETLEDAQELMNKMPIFQLLLLIGPPASGKSTYCKQLQKQFPDVKVISMDQRRKELCGDENDQSKNSEIFGWQERELREAMKNRQSTIVDATNPTRKLRKILWQLGRQYGAVVGAVFFDISLQTLLERNVQREKEVPVTVVERFYKALQNVTPEECDGLRIIDK